MRDSPHRTTVHTRGYSRRVPKHDIAVYSPPTGNLFRRSRGRTGGAERQMALLASELARRGRRVAVVVYPVPDPGPEVDRRLTLVERGTHAGGGAKGTLVEAVRVIRALVRANPRVVVVRGGKSVVGVVAAYCLFWRRKLVFSSANDFDFLGRAELRGRRLRLYRFGVRRADAVVVQSTRQLELARHAFPTVSASRLIRIPSFAGDAPRPVDGTPTEFFWVGRLIDYKRPLLYADLAAAVPEARFVLIPLLPPDLTAEQSQLLAQLESAAPRTPNLALESSLPHAALMGRLGRAVAVVNTSVFEGMPNTFLEAWSLGVPVLTLSFDPDDVVRERALGVAAGGSWERFVDGARELWGGRFEREELSKRLLAYVRETHAPEAVGHQWDTLLERLGAFPRRDAQRRSEDLPFTRDPA
jgi:glycosyltransferase involved in cell wall biosynthesis